MDESSLLPIWRALADTKRRQIIELLEAQPRTTKELSEFFDVSRFAVMKHLNVLEQAGLIKVRREGRRRWNMLNDELVHFLRTSPGGSDDGPDQLARILGFFPLGHPRESEPLTRSDSVCIRLEIQLPGSAREVFLALTDGSALWQHWATTSPAELQLEPRVGGRLYLALDDTGQGELYATVTYFKKDEELRLSGPMGVADAATVGLVRIILEPHGNGTRLKLTHHIAGEVTGQMVEEFRRRWNGMLNGYLKQKSY